MTIPLRIYKSIKSVFHGTGINKIYPVTAINRFLLKKIKSDHALVHGHKMFLDSNDSLSLSINGIYEEFETNFFKKRIRNGDVIIDIGANIGYYTLLFAKLVGKNGKVFAFEPDPTNFSILKKNIKENGYKNVVLINKAVSSKTGKLKLFLADDNKADHRTYDSKDNRDFVEINCIKLDDYFKNKNIKINIIKMDIQGFEYEAVKGMSKLLKNNNDLIIVSEFWPMGLKKSGSDPADYLRLLAKHKFKISVMDDSKNTITPINDTSSLLKKYTIENDNFANILCEKK